MTSEKVIPINTLLNGQDEEVDLLYKLAALGAANYFGGYNNVKLSEFDMLSFEAVSRMWPHLYDSLKLRFIKNHETIFTEAIKNAR